MTLDNNKVLIVDDDESSREALAACLLPLNVAVLQADNGELGLQIMAQEQPVLVILDSEMPDLDGYQVLNRMHNDEKTRQIPIIFMLANLSSDKYLLHKPLIDLIDCVTKPINFSLLQEKVTAHLTIHHYRNLIRGLNKDNAKLLEAMDEGVLGVDTDGVIRFANIAACKMLHKPVIELKGVYIETIFQEPNHKAVSRWNNHPIAQVCRKQTILQVDKADFWRADGKVLKVKFAAVPVDKVGEIGLVLAFRELEQPASEQESMSQLTNIDYLTGFPNIKRFKDILNEALEAVVELDVQLAVMIINLDHFRYINEVLGHEMGDKLLLAVGQRIMKTVRSHDVLARLGGDEFALLLTEPIASPASAGVIANKIISSLKHAFLIDGHEIFTGCSIGIAIYPACGDTPNALLKNADAALLRAKQYGRNSFQYHSVEINNTIFERMALERDLYQALTKQQMHLTYEPVLAQNSDGTRSLKGTEVKLTWDHDRRGKLALNKFVNVAEDIGVLAEISHWMYDQAFYELDEEKKRSEHMVFFYLSPQLLLSDNFVDWLSNKFKIHALDGNQVVMQICESVFLRQRQIVLEHLGRLSDLGVKLAVTEFGVGYGTFELLRLADIEIIKLPEHFVARIADDRESVLCQHIVRLAHDLGIKVWVDQVDSEAQYLALKQLNVDYYQGEFFTQT